MGQAKKQHIATHAILGGFTGVRVGTRYLFTFEEARDARNKPGFRWRNEECRRTALSAARATGGRE